MEQLANHSENFAEDLLREDLAKATTLNEVIEIILSDQAAERILNQSSKPFNEVMSILKGIDTSLNQAQPGWAYDAVKQLPPVFGLPGCVIKIIDEQFPVEKSSMPKLSETS